MKDKVVEGQKDTTLKKKKEKKKTTPSHAEIQYLG